MKWFKKKRKSHCLNDTLVAYMYASVGFPDKSPYEDEEK